MMQCTDLPAIASNAAIMFDSSVELIGMPLIGMFLFVALMVGIWRILF